MSQVLALEKWVVHSWNGRNYSNMFHWEINITMLTRTFCISSFGISVVNHIQWRTLKSTHLVQIRIQLFHSIYYLWYLCLCYSVIYMYRRLLPTWLHKVCAWILYPFYADASIYLSSTWLCIHTCYPITSRHNFPFGFVFRSWLVGCITARQHRKINLWQLRGRDTGLVG